MLIRYCAWAHDAGTQEFFKHIGVTDRKEIVGNIDDIAEALREVVLFRTKDGRHVQMMVSPWKDDEDGEEKVALIFDTNRFV